MKAKPVVALASSLAISFFATSAQVRADDERAQPAPSAQTASGAQNESSAHTASAAEPARDAHSLQSANESKYRLPGDVIPEFYNLVFTPNLKDFSFRGTATIDIQAKRTTDTIVLNALDLKITSAKLMRINYVEEVSKNPRPPMETGTTSLDPEHEQARIVFQTPLEAGGIYRLKLEFIGELNDKLRGFYRSHYIDDKGEKKWLATTQMEPTDARRMFPSFDEPEMKAKFKITAKIEPGLTAISNGTHPFVNNKYIAPDVLNSPHDKLSSQGAAKLTNFTFETSPKMSSYLVALIIGDFKPTETKVVDGIPVTVWALAGKEHLGKYALDAACEILQYQRKYFGIKYPGSKLDLIAIPDFRSGAMENLGAITFRETNLLVDEKTASNSAKKNVFAIIAHEIAHQWFGDLVTMKWWNDIWLNEAFASWMGTKTVEAIHPEWQELTKAILTRNGSMLVDELQATRAIHSDVADPKQAAEMFDSITYDKGESILWMLESYVGAKKFQQGIYDYLAAHTFGNATSEDLWNAIGKASKLPVSDLMKSWVFQPGFPLLKVGDTTSGSTTAGDTESGKTDSSTTHGDQTLPVSQQRFFGMPDVKPDDSIWQIPVSMRELKPFAKDNKTITHLITTQTGSLPIPNGWSALLINAGGRGFYRTEYTSQQRTSIFNHFEWLSTEERLAALSDLSALTWKGLIPVQSKLGLMHRLASEKDPIVQEKLMDVCRHPYVYLDRHGRQEYKELMRQVVGPVKFKLGWTAKPGEADSVKDLRRSAIDLLGTFGENEKTVSEAREFYTRYMKDRQSVPADVASAVLTVTAYNGGEKEYNEIIEALKTEKIPELEKRFLSALTHFHQPELVDRTLNMVLSDEVRSQDGFRVLAGMLNGHRTKHQTWAFVKSRWNDVVKKFPPRSLANLAYACGSFDKPEEEDDLKQFFADHDLPYARSAVARMLEEVHRRVLYRQKNEEAIRAWVHKAAEPPIPDSR